MNGIEATSPVAPRRLDIEQLRQRLNTEMIGQGDRFLYLPETTSTNSFAMDLARTGSEEGVVVLTDSQTAGKGRQGRRWVDMAGCNAISSIILHPEFPPHLLVMIASLAVVSAIAETCSIHATIKWPNDVLVNEQKVAGILIETRSNQMGRFVAVIGIGVNVNGHFPMSQTDEDVARMAARAITLEDACGHTVNRETFLVNLWRQLETRYVALQQEARTTPTGYGSISRLIREQWRDQLSTLGRTIQVRQGDTLLSGVAEEVNEHGELLLRCHSGERICITWGDVN